MICVVVQIGVGVDTWRICNVPTRAHTVAMFGHIYVIFVIKVITAFSQIFYSVTHSTPDFTPIKVLSTCVNKTPLPQLMHLLQ